MVDVVDGTSEVEWMTPLFPSSSVVTVVAEVKGDEERAAATVSARSDLVMMDEMDIIVQIVGG